MGRGSHFMRRENARGRRICSPPAVFHRFRFRGPFWGPGAIENGSRTNIYPWGRCRDLSGHGLKKITSSDIRGRGRDVKVSGCFELFGCLGASLPPVTSATAHSRGGRGIDGSMGDGEGSWLEDRSICELLGLRIPPGTSGTSGEPEGKRDGEGGGRDVGMERRGGWGGGGIAWRRGREGG